MRIDMCPAFNSLDLHFFFLSFFDHDSHSSFTDFFFRWILLQGREEKKISMIEAYMKANRMYRDFNNTEQDPVFSEVSPQRLVSRKNIKRIEIV